jgi:hypothetical protein
LEKQVWGIKGIKIVYKLSSHGLATGQNKVRMKYLLRNTGCKLFRIKTPTTSFETLETGA